jgi:hypothetical protein
MKNKVFGELNVWADERIPNGRQPPGKASKAEANTYSNFVTLNLVALFAKCHLR